MAKMVTDTIKNNILHGLDYILTDIENCPPKIWEQKSGGDYIWQQVLHTLAVSHSLLSDSNSVMPDFPESKEVLLLRDDSYKGDHSKELMYKNLHIIKDNIELFFANKNDNDLSQKVNFFGNPMPMLNMLLLASGHIYYHLGVFDAALREDGIKTAL